ncbi:uncharacterized protein METZ01_LOCUS43537 [marine metagenome]|uniref:Uncharacterized protein n=1 Tax=marine metagenome TaxID=408172 RepID=A0A381RP67_9ZZZZ
MIEQSLLGHLGKTSSSQFKQNPLNS